MLDILEKHHTKADIEQAVKVVRAAGIAPRPTWVAFTPWTTLGDYLDMLEFIEANQLIDNVDPVQYTIRLLIPPGSYILNRPEMKPHLGALNQASFSYTWVHPDPRMDRLHKEVNALVEKDVHALEDPMVTFRASGRWPRADASVVVRPARIAVGAAQVNRGSAERSRPKVVGPIAERGQDDVTHRVSDGAASQALPGTASGSAHPRATRASFADARQARSSVPGGAWTD